MRKRYQRPLLVAGEQATYIGPLVAVQPRAVQLDESLRILAHPVRQVVLQLPGQSLKISRQIHIGHFKLVYEDLRQTALQITLRVVSTYLWWPLVDPQCRAGGMDEHAAVTDLVMAEQAAKIELYQVSASSSSKRLSICVM